MVKWLYQNERREGTVGMSARGSGVVIRTTISCSPEVNYNLRAVNPLLAAIRRLLLRRVGGMGGVGVAGGRIIM